MVRDDTLFKRIKARNAPARAMEADAPFFRSLSLSKGAKNGAGADSATRGASKEVRGAAAHDKRATKRLAQKNG